MFPPSHSYLAEISRLQREIGYWSAISCVLSQMVIYLATQPEIDTNVADALIMYAAEVMQFAQSIPDDWRPTDGKRFPEPPGFPRDFPCS